MVLIQLNRPIPAVDLIMTHAAALLLPTRLAERVNALLVKRMSTLRRDIVHVSELMRDSISRIQDITPASSLAAAGSTRVSDPGMPPSRLSLSAAEAAVPAGGSSSSGGAGGGAPTASGAAAAVVPASRLSIDPTSGVSGTGQAAAAAAAGAAEVVALAALELPSPVAACEGLTGVHGVAGLAEQGASANNSRAATPHQLVLSPQQQHQRVIDPDGIQVQVVKQPEASSKQRGKLSAVVSQALQQPIPAGAYVVRDVKISSLAGELDM
jgi:hypothetical protein